VKLTKNPDRGKLSVNLDQSLWRSAESRSWRRGLEVTNSVCSASRTRPR